MRKVMNLVIVGVTCFFLGMTEIKADRPEELIIAGTNIITAKDNTVVLKEGKAIYDPSNRVLTLENTTIVDEAKPDSNTSIEVTMNEPITIKLIGDNTTAKRLLFNTDVVFTGPGNLTVDVLDHIAIKSEANLTIQDDATLTIKSNQVGLFVDREIKIAESTLNIKTGDIGVYTRFDAKIHYSNLNIEVDMVNSSSIYCERHLEIIASDITAKSAKQTLAAVGTVKINDGELDLTSTTDVAIYSDAGIITIMFSKLDITEVGSFIDQTANYTTNADYTELTNALERYNNLPHPEAYYTNESKSKVEELLKKFQVYTNKEQDIADAYIQQVVDAVDNLELLPAEVDKLDDALALVPKDLNYFKEVGVKKINELLVRAGASFTIVDQADVDKLARDIKQAVDDLIALDDYLVLNKESLSWKKNSKNGLEIKIDAELGDFRKVFVEGKELDAINYDLKAGSTILTLKPEYLQSLDTQDYNLEVFFANGYATPTIKVMPGTVSKAVLPATGLSNNPIYLAVLFLIIGPGLLSINILTKKENKV